MAWLLGRPFSDTKIIAGRRLFEGKAAHRRLKEIAKGEMAVSGAGIKLHPGFDWHLSRERETRHFLLVGSVGGGKTQILTPMVLAAIGRGDRVLIFDIKADFTSTLPVDFALLAPWDSRSMVWDVARDCVNAQDARELAAQLIPSGQDPMWHQAARQILTAVIQQLQAYKADAWTWKDLHQLSASSQEDLLNIVSRFTRRRQIYWPVKAKQRMGFSSTSARRCPLLPTSPPPGATWIQVEDSRFLSGC